MSKFLALVEENNPVKSQKHQLLEDLINVLSHSGFECKNTPEGVLITVQDADEDQEDPVAQAVGVLTTADKAFPETPGLLKRLISPKARAIKAAKDSAMDALVAAVKKASDTIKKSVTSISY